MNSDVSDPIHLAKSSAILEFADQARRLGSGEIGTYIWWDVGAGVVVHQWLEAQLGDRDLRDVLRENPDLYDQLLGWLSLMWGAQTTEAVESARLKLALVLEGFRAGTATAESLAMRYNELLGASVLTHRRVVLEESIADLKVRAPS